jgi:hypothetical protein
LQIDGVAIGAVVEATIKAKKDYGYVAKVGHL